MLRAIERFVDLSDLALFDSAIGRPSVDPGPMIRMLRIGWHPLGTALMRKSASQSRLGFVGSDWTAKFRIIPPFRRTVMVAFARAMLSGAALYRGRPRWWRASLIPAGAVPFGSDGSARRDTPQEYLDTRGRRGRGQAEVHLLLRSRSAGALNRRSSSTSAIISSI
jgi:hypothetical protein